MSPHRSPRAAVAIETSGRFGSIAVRADDRILFRGLENAKAHASDLLPALDELLEEGGIHREAGSLPVEDIFVGTGPGSYTGLRIGIATALGLHRGTGGRLLGVASFEALAFHELEPGTEGTVAVDARAGRFYFARFRRSADDVEVIHPPSAVGRDELLRALPEAGPLFVDAAMEGSLELPPETRNRLRVDVAPRADAVLELGLRRMARDGAQQPGELEPLYLRAFGE